VNADQLNQVWTMLDREHLASLARNKAEPVFAAISGAHLYGFASPDSDIDLRGAFILSARELLGLHPPPETIAVEDKTVINLDWVAHDIRKFARLMTNHNGYVLEQLFSPLVVISTPAHEELLELGKGCVTRPTTSLSRLRAGPPQAASGARPDGQAPALCLPRTPHRHPPNAHG
jgi:hypothetical protein